MSAKARLGFVGLGWIGRLRLDAVTRAGAAEVAALCDRDPAALAEVAAAHPDARRHADLEDLLGHAGDLDGVVIATPNALHVPQAVAALEAGLAVFVQKPLALRAEGARRVLEAARAADRSVAVDYSYRGLEGARRVRERVAEGALGEVFLVESHFHNAFGPDKAWCFDPRLSGGGALLDLGVHLIDLAAWCLDTGVAPSHVTGWRRPLPEHPGIEGWGVVDFRLGVPGPRVRVAASWHAHAGRDCAFSLRLHGTGGAAEIRNVAGSFYDFETLERHGRGEETLVEEGRAWMDREIVGWAGRIARDPSFDPAAAHDATVAEVLDRVYGWSAEAHQSLPSPPPPVAARSSS